MLTLIHFPVLLRSHSPVLAKKYSAGLSHRLRSRRTPVW
jgi:hypothetical protein